MSVHRRCCCDTGSSRYWLVPTCDDAFNPPSTVVVFDDITDCGLSPNFTIYEYDDGSFAALKYCGVFRREGTFPIPAKYAERIVDSSDCGDFTATDCVSCVDDVCAYWEDCEGPGLSVTGYTDNGWQYPDDGFGQSTHYRARVTGVNIGTGTWTLLAGFGYRWEYDITVTVEAELMEEVCQTSALFTSTGCDGDDPLDEQTWTWDTTMTLVVDCDGGLISDTGFDPQGPYVCSNARKYDVNGNPTDYFDASQWKASAAQPQNQTQTSTLAATSSTCVFTGDWSVTAGIDVFTDLSTANSGEEERWTTCAPFTGLFQNAIQLTISGRYGP